MAATLHEAMVEVLKGQGWMRLDAVAEAIAAGDLWRRPSDGKYPGAAQIDRRARQAGGRYRHLFDLRPGEIRLRNDPHVGSRNPT